MRIHFLSHLYGAITKIENNVKPAYTTKVCFGCSFARIMPTPCQKKVNIDA